MLRKRKTGSGMRFLANLGFVLKRVHLSGAATHAQEDDAFSAVRLVIGREAVDPTHYGQ